MPKPVFRFFLFAFCGAFAAAGIMLPDSAQATTRTFRGTTAGSFASFLENTVEDGDIINIVNDINFDFRVNVTKNNIRIRSASGRRRILRDTSSGRTGIMIITGNNVRFTRLSLRTPTTGTIFNGMLTPQGNGFRAARCDFRGGDAGILWVGGGIANMRVVGCDFINCRAGIQFIRDVVRAVGNNNSQRRARAFSPGLFDFVRCNFSGDRLEIGILMDAGNDAPGIANPTPNNPSGDIRFPFQNNSLRQDAQNRTTNFSGSGRRSLISECTMTGVRLFGVGLARCQNVDIRNNIITMSTGGAAFRNAVQLENRTRDVTLADNVINLNNGSGNNAGGIIMVTFTDYGNAARFENGCRRIFIARNRINGNGGNGIGSDGFSGVRVEFNRLSENLRRRFNFFSRPGGGNAFDRSSRGNVIINSSNGVVRNSNPGPNTQS